MSMRYTAPIRYSTTTKVRTPSCKCRCSQGDVKAEDTLVWWNGLEAFVLTLTLCLSTRSDLWVYQRSFNGWCHLTTPCLACLHPAVPISHSQTNIVPNLVLTFGQDEASLVVAAVAIPSYLSCLLNSSDRFSMEECDSCWTDKGWIRIFVIKPVIAQ